MKWIAAAVIALLTHSAYAIKPTEADFQRWSDNWDRLIPLGVYDFIPETLTFEEAMTDEFQRKLDEAAVQLNPKLQNQIIELAGYMVPMAFDGERVTEFLLVPEAGQCVHVPPPPVNQTVLVHTPTQPVELRHLYQPITVTGTLSVGQQSFDLADTGYTLTRVTVDTIELDPSEIAIPPGADGELYYQPQE